MKTKEVFKAIEGYEGLYEVSNLGNVKSLYFNKILKQKNRKRGYKFITLCKEGIHKHYYIHRLVASAFIPNPTNLPHINHKDENPSNNCVENLEWCSPSYNNNYGTRLERLSQTLKYSENVHRKAVASYDITTGKLVKVYSSLTEASQQLGVVYVAISNCINNKSATSCGYYWKYVESVSAAPTEFNSSLSVENEGLDYDKAITVVNF